MEFTSVAQHCCFSTAGEEGRAATDSTLHIRALPCFQYFSTLILGQNTLSHESPDAEPEAVEQSEVVLYQGGGRVAGMRVVPLVRGEPARTRPESKLSVRKTQKTLTGDSE